MHTCTCKHFHEGDVERYTQLNVILILNHNISFTLVLSWLNPIVKVAVNGKLVPAIGIRSMTLEEFAQVSVKVIYAATDDVPKIGIIERP